MADKIVLSFTKGQYRRLLDMVYLGNLILSDDEKYNEEAFNEVESIVFSKVAQIGRPQYAKCIEEYGGWLPTKEYEDKSVLKTLDNYEEHNFWDSLAYKLALRDVAKFADINNPDILYENIMDRYDQYVDYFNEHDFSDVIVKGMEELKRPETFRSMDVGQIDMSGFNDDDDDDHDCDCEHCDCDDDHDHDCNCGHCHK